MDWRWNKGLDMGLDMGSIGDEIGYEEEIDR